MLYFISYKSVSRGVGEIAIPHAFCYFFSIEKVEMLYLTAIFILY